MSAEAQVKVNIKGDQSQLASELNKSRAGVRDWANNVEGSTKDLFKTPHVNLLHLSRGMITAFSVGGIIESIKNLVKQSDEASAAAIKMSESLDVPLAKYDEWKAKADSVGLSLEKMNDIIKDIEQHGGSLGDISVAMGTNPNSPGNTTQSALDKAKLEPSLVGQFKGIIGNAFSTVWTMAGVGIADLFRKDKHFQQIIEGTYQTDADVQAAKAKEVDDALKAKQDKEKEQEDEVALNKKAIEANKRLTEEGQRARDNVLSETKEDWMESRKPGMPKEYEDAELEKIRRARNIARAAREEQQENDRISVSSINATGLGAVGGYTGSHSDRGMMALAERQLQVLKNHDKYLEKIADNTTE